MILNSPTISGSLTVTGNIITSGSITISGSIASASYASNAELLDGLDATVFTLTSSFNAQTASFTAFTASLNAFSASQNSFTASILAQTASLNAFSASILTFTGSASTRLGALESYTSSLNDKTSSFATTGSNTFIGTQTVTGSVLQSGSFTSTGTLTAQTLVVQTITSSVVYSSGSNIFGNDIGNTQTFTGSVLVTGSLTIAAGGNVSAPTIFGSTIACSPIGCFATSCATSFIGGTLSGTTIYGSTAVCSPVGKFTSCIDVSGTGRFNGTSASPLLSLTNTTGGTLADFTITENVGLIINSYEGATARSIDFKVAGTSALLIASTGAATFSSNVTISGGNDLIFRDASTYISSPATDTLRIITANNERMRITSAGIACFACQVCVGGDIKLDTGAADAQIILKNNASGNPRSIAYNVGDASISFNRTSGGAGATFFNSGVACFANTICLPTSNTSLVAGTYGTISNVGGVDVNIGNNAYYDGTNWRRFAAQEAARIYINRDSFSFLRKTSDGAGSCISWDNTLFLASTGVACFASAVCAPSFIGGTISGTSIQVTGQIARIDTIYLGGGLNGTGNATAACYQIESAYALASSRTSVSKGSQYAGSNYYILLSAAQDVYVYYKLALIQSSYFCAYAKFTNAQDGTNRTGISQYSFDNGGTWSTLGSATFGAGSGTAGGGVATSSGNYSGVVVFRTALCNGSGNGSLIGIDQLHFMSCGYGMHFINTLG